MNFIRILLNLTNLTVTQTIPGPPFAAITLPPEICELCIDALADIAKDDKRSRAALAQCLHVCRLFWIRARGHIFRDVQILGRRTLKDQASVEEQLASLLALMNPNGPTSRFSVATLIKSFTFTFDTDSFNINRPSFSPVLQGFLDAQVLHGLHLKTPLLRWTEVDASIQVLIRALCQTTHLKTLFLSQILLIPANILEGTTIRHFGTFYGDIREWDTLSSPPQLVSFQGYNLTFSDFPTSPSMHTRAIFSQLEKLESFITQKVLEATYALAQMSCNSLHTLHLTFSSTSVPTMTTFDLTTQLPNLRHLRLGLFVTYRGAGELEHLCRFIAPSSALQSIAVEITHSMCGVPLSLNDHVHCRALERTLLQSCVPQAELVVNIGLLDHREDIWAFVASETRTTLELFFSALLKNEAINFKINIIPVSPVI